MDLHPPEARQNFFDVRGARTGLSCRELRNPKESCVALCSCVTRRDAPRHQREPAGRINPLQAGTSPLILWCCYCRCAHSHKGSTDFSTRGRSLLSATSPLASRHVAHRIWRPLSSPTWPLNIPATHRSRLWNRRDVRVSRLPVRAFVRDVASLDSRVGVAHSRRAESKCHGRPAPARALVLARAADHLARAARRAVAAGEGV